MRRTKKIFIFLGVAVVLFFGLGFMDDFFMGNLLSGVVVRVFGDSMDWRSHRMMGWRGIDCGTVKIGTDPAAATDCALQAQSQGKAFRVRYNIQGIDSDVAGGIVRTTSGELYALSFDGDPSGGGRTSLVRQHSAKFACPQPYHLWVNPKGRVNCFQPQLSTSKDIMSPSFESY